MRFTGEAPVANGRKHANGTAIDGHRPAGRPERRYDLLPATAAAFVHGLTEFGRDIKNAVRNRRWNGINVFCLDCFDSAHHDQCT